MAEFTLVPSKRFENDFRDLPKDTQRQVLAALSRLQADPHRGRRLRGITIGEWRYRVGDYRVRHDIRGKTIFLHVVRHRKDVYR